MASPPPEIICLRQGYQCTCPACQIWIAHWQKETDSFALIDDMIQNKKKSLFEIYERLRCEYPTTLRLYHRWIEDQYFEARREKETQELPKKIPPPPLSLRTLPTKNNKDVNLINI
jgi:hypothetical protein